MQERDVGVFQEKNAEDGSAGRRRKGRPRRRFMDVVRTWRT